MYSQRKKGEMRYMQIGIDFGTCYSSVAIMNGLMPVTTCVKDTTGLGVPSLFMYSVESNKELYGEQCKTGESFRHSEDIVRYMKRTVRENPGNLEARIMSGGQEYLLKEIIEKFIAYLISEAKKGATEFGEFSNTEIEEITITAPVGISEGQMLASDYNQLLMDVVEGITGLTPDHIHILMEPVAAAISYLYGQDIRHHYDKDQTVLVFDLGGGTLDVTIMEHDIKSMQYKILAKEGDLCLGGNDWDSALGKAVLEKIGMTEISSAEERAQFEEAVSKLKVELTQNEESVIFFTVDGEDKYTKFSRQEFEAVTQDLADKTVDVVNKALGFFEPGLSGIDKIVLVGGSCNMPQIRNRLVSEFPDFDENNILLFEPSKAIAKGAAIFAKLSSNHGGNDAGPRVLDMAGHTYGFESNYEGRYPRIYNMIFKGTHFDEEDVIRAKAETSFIPHSNDQTKVCFTVYESDSRKGDGEDANWADFGNGESPNGLEVTVQVPPEYLGKARSFRMWPELAFDANGILEITVRDRAGNKLAFNTSAAEAKGDA